MFISTEWCGIIFVRFIIQKDVIWCVLNECGYVEIILRNIAFQETKEMAFFEQDSNTLGTLLKHRKYKILSEGLLYYLEFYLSKENNNKLRSN